MLKILGAALLVLCGAGLGFRKLSREKRELELICAMDGALGLMSGEIELCARPLPELFGLAAQRGPGQLRDFFSCLGACCAAMSAGEAWEGCCMALEGPETLKRALLPLSAVLGRCDSARQCAEIALVRRELRAQAEAASARLAQRGRSWPALGACLAGVAALLMI